LIDVNTDWEWRIHPGQMMINKVASSFQVDVRLKCMIKCTLSPICDSYNYRPSDKLCQFNTHDTPHTVDSCVHAAASGLVLQTRPDSSPHTTLNTLLRQVCPRCCQWTCPSDKTCQFNTHDTQHTVDSSVHAAAVDLSFGQDVPVQHTTLHTL